MRVLALILAMTFLAVFLALPANGAGYLWDIGGGLGLAAFSGLMFQMLPVARTKTSKRHQTLGYWVMGAAFAHAFWMLVGDGVVHLYLKLGAPLYMWLGVLSLLCLAILASLARMPDRMRVHRRFAAFRLTHRILAFAVTGTAAAHIFLSGFYYPSAAQVVLMVLLLSATSVGRGHWARLGEPPTVSGLTYLAMGTAFLTAFVLIRNAGS